MKPFLGVLVAALLTLGITSVAASQPAGSGVGIALLDAPGQSYITETLQPGAEITRALRVYNNTGTARDIAVTVGAAGLDADGHFVDLPPDRTSPLTRWTQVDRPTVRLAAGKSADVTVTIQVPSDAPDTVQRALVFAEAGGARAGLRMFVTVDGDNGPAAAPVIETITGERRADGTAVVRARVTNTAAYPVRATGELDLTAGPGADIRGVRGAETTIAPGASADVLFVVPGGRGVAEGPWQAAVTVDDGYARADSAGPVTFPGPAGGGAGTGSLGSLGDAGSLGSLAG